MQIFNALPDHLLQAVLSSAPLPACLTTLPPPYHPAALRAHHPSADSSDTLHLTNLTPDAVAPAVDATHHLTHLHALSISSLTLPASPPLSTLLHALPHLTSISLRDSAISPAAAGSLAAALPDLQALRELDLSENTLPLPAMHALVPALPRCAALTSLQLRATVPLSPPSAGSLTALAAALPPRLAALSVGGVGPQCASRPDRGLSSAVVALLQALGSLPRVIELTLEFTNFKLAAHQVTPFAAALARLSHLTYLFLTVPHLGAPITRAQPDDTDDVSEAGDAPPSAAQDSNWSGERDVLGQSLTVLTSLKALKLDTCGLTFARRQAVPLLAHLSTLTGLRMFSMHLRDGRLQSPEAPFQAAVVLSALPHLTLLTQLRCHCSTFAPRAASIAQLVDLVSTSMPGLRVLHLPMEARYEGGTHLVLSLLSATHIENLSIDMYAAVNFGLDEEAYTAEIENDDFLEPYTPLFPYVHALDVYIDEWHDWWLVPVSANLAAFTALRKFSLCTTEIDSGGPVCEILRGISQVRGLEDLTVDVTFVDDDAAPPLHWFSPEMSRLTRLTALQCSVFCGVDVTRLAQQVLPVCPYLRKLQMPMCPLAEREVAVAALQRLPLRTLVVWPVRPGFAEIIGDTLRGMRELRSLQLHGRVSPAERLRVHEAAGESAACYDVRIVEE